MAKPQVWKLRDYVDDQGNVTKAARVEVRASRLDPGTFYARVLGENGSLLSAATSYDSYIARAQAIAYLRFAVYYPKQEISA